MTHCVANFLLSRTHYRLLLRVNNPAARAFYEAKAVNARWPTLELERRINSLLYPERLALSRDKAGVIAPAEKGHEITRPSDLVKDPIVLEFTGLRQDERFRESDLEQALIAKLQPLPARARQGIRLHWPPAADRARRRTFLHRDHASTIGSPGPSRVLWDLKVGKLDTHQDIGHNRISHAAIAYPRSKPARTIELRQWSESPRF